MRKSILILACLYLSAIAVLAQNSDEEKNVRLSDEQTQEIISSKPDADTYYRIVITKGETNDKGDTEVTMEVDNRSESNYLWLFGRSLDKDELRRDWHIVFDKSQKNQVRVEKYSTGEKSLTQKYICVSPQNQDSLSIIIKDGEERTCTLPIYYVKERKSWFNRWKILGCETKILKISIERSFKLDENYDRLQRQCDSLLDAISHVQFCKHKQHRTPLEKQKEPYEDAIDDLVEKISIIIDANHWPTTDQNYKNYNELITKLKIDLQDYEVDDCGDKNMHATPHECKYCSENFETLCNRLEQYFIKKDEGKLTQKDKNEVKMIYSCYKKGRRKGDAEDKKFKKQIEDYYKAIMK